MKALVPKCLLVAASLTTAACSNGGGASSMLPAGGVGAAPSSVSVAAGGAGSSRSAAAVAQAPAGWANTATQIFNLRNASDGGLLNGAQTLTVRLGLQLQNANALKAAVASGQVLSPGTVAADGPSASQVAAVTSYLQSQGFTNISAEPNNLIVSASASAAIVAKAFDTTLHSFSQNGVAVYANTAPAYVPQSLAGIVVAILGLNDVPTFQVTPHKGASTAPPTPRIPAATAPTPCEVQSVELVGLPSPVTEPSTVANQAGCLRTYAPADYWRAYDALDATPANGVAVAIMAEGDTSSAISDFRVNEQGDQLTTVPITVKQVGLASPDTSGAGEWTLDMSASSGMARNLRALYVYQTTSLTDSDIALEYNRFVTDDLAKIGNSSFGGCEYGPYLDGSMVLDDEILLEGAAQGQTMFASTGDTGSFCSVGTPNGVPAGAPLVEYPAASPYVVAVGGTTLMTQTDGSYQGEAAWYSGGGGLSQFEYSPNWESPTQPVGTTSAGFSFRGLPDIAMDADLQTGMNLYSAGSWSVIGGTSLASPLAAGTWARVLQAHPGLGFAAPRLYATYAAQSATPGVTLAGPPPTRPIGGFHDILTGANGIYTALPNYDYTTGMGSIDVQTLISLIGS